MLALSLSLLSCSLAAQVTISNTVPRRDTDGAILDAHDSKLNFHSGLYYWHAASYGNCTEPKGPSGCSPVTVGSCGFQTDHNVSLYTSADLVTWKNEGVAFTATGNLPPHSVLFAPKTVYNAKTAQWVMWFNYITNSFTNSFYGVATSSNPAGPFTVVNKNVALQFQDNGDEGLFVDDDGQAYVIYTTLSKGHSISIERLSPDYTTSLGAAASSGIFGPGNVEAPALFKRNGVYYATFGSCCQCCFPL
jgi:beta-xylosidase